LIVCAFEVLVAQMLKIIAANNDNVFIVNKF
jgi:hypothetical protein